MIEPGTKVIYNGRVMTLLEHDGETAVCEWRHKGNLKADLFRMKDLSEKTPQQMASSYERE